jgi:hypothetical protein
VNRQKVLLGILAVLFLVVAWSYLGGGDDEPTGPPAAMNARPHAADEEGAPVPAAPAATPAVAGAGRGGRGEAAAAREVKELRVAQLDQVPHSFTPGRDPWRFYVPPPPPPTPVKPPSREEQERMRLLAEERLRQQREAEEKARYIKEHTPPAFTMSYLGTFGPPNRRFAVFSDGKTIYNVPEGKPIAGNFVLSHIGYESVDVSYTLLPEAPPQRVAAGVGKPGAPGFPGAGVPPR